MQSSVLKIDDKLIFTHKGSRDVSEEEFLTSYRHSRFRILHLLYKSFHLKTNKD